MTDPLKEMRELIVQESQVDEGVITVLNEDGTFLVSTRLGVATVSGNTDLFQVGDSVKIVDGVITAKTSSEDDLVVHEL